jgi:hypothetical protein
MVQGQWFWLCRIAFKVDGVNIGLLNSGVVCNVDVV